MEGELIRFALSLGAVSLLVFAVHLLGFSAPARLASDDEVDELLSLVPGGFRPVQIAPDRNGKGAIARDAAGRLLLLRPHGAQFVVQLVEPAAVRIEDGKLLVLWGDWGASIVLDIGSGVDGWATAPLRAAAAA